MSTTGQDAVRVLRGELPEPEENRPGTTWAQALAEAEGVGVSRCSDPAAMAQFLDACARTLIGPGIDPRLMWEGAQKMGLTNLELSRMIHADPVAAADLMFYRM